MDVMGRSSSTEWYPRLGGGALSGVLGGHSPGPCPKYESLSSSLKSAIPPRAPGRLPWNALLSPDADTLSADAVVDGNADDRDVDNDTSTEVTCDRACVATSSMFT